MSTPLNTSASTAGALLSTSTFEIPQFQREYSWQDDEVEEFWRDLQGSLEADSYFLGLVILTDEEGKKHVVDGQQRLLTVSLLATALHFEALKRGRTALADRIQADFLRSIDYATDSTDPRVTLSDASDNETFQYILDNGNAPPPSAVRTPVSERLVASYDLLSRHLKADLRTDPFKRLGKWTEFLTHRVYFAVFVHPEPSSAYQVFEVINTRGKELTTADLLKNYVLSETPKKRREERYQEWQDLSRPFPRDGSNNFVQFIRHSVTARYGHVLPKDLFSFLAGRIRSGERDYPRPEELMSILHGYSPLYLQMIDPSSAGPADPEALKIFSALNSLGVISVRPILLALHELPDSIEGMRYVLRLVLRRIVVGNLGTGNVERMFGEAARNVFSARSWLALRRELSSLNPSREEFEYQAHRRSLNKGVLGFLRRSVLQGLITPVDEGTLHFIWTRQANDWVGMSEEDGSFWGSTLGNTFLASVDRRPREAVSWDGFKAYLLPYSIDGELSDYYAEVAEWTAEEISSVGVTLAGDAVNLWYS